jgi:hypothetical protein
MPPVALQEDEVMLVGRVVVEPAGPHDRVGHAAGANESFGPALPVVRLGGAVIPSEPLGHADRGHQRDARIARVKRSQDVPHATIVHVFLRVLPLAVGAEGHHDSVHAIHRIAECVETGNVADYRLRLCGNLARLLRSANEGAHGVSVTKRLFDDEASDAAGCADDKNCHGRRLVHTYS